MDKKKEYIPPKCVSLSGDASGQAKGACVNGSYPDSPCWNGSSPTGGEGECSTGGVPILGVCTDLGQEPTADDCLSGSNPGGTCDTGTSG